MAEFVKSRYSNEAFKRSLGVMIDSDADDLSHDKPDIWGSLVQSVLRIALAKGVHLEKDPFVIKQLSKLEKMGIIPVHLYEDVADTMIKQYKINLRAGRAN